MTEGAARSGLSRVVVSGVRWTVGARLVRIVSTIGALAVLSRLLTPEAFGTVALIMFVVGLAQVLGDFGARIALVQRPEIDERDRSTAFWFNAALFVLLFALTQAFAPAIADLFDTPEMTGPLRWTSVIFLVQAFQGVSLSLLERRYEFRTIALAETAGSVLGSLAAVIAALLGAQIGALIVQVVGATVVTTGILLVRARWRPRAIFDPARLMPLLRFGGYLTLSGFLQFASANAHRPIVGSGLSPVALGYMSVSQQVVSTPIKVIAQMVRKVMFPVLSSIQEDEVRTRTAYLRTVHALMLVMAPVCLGLAAVAGPFVALLLGDGWETVAILIAMMAPAALFGAQGDLTATLFLARGRGRFIFFWSLGLAVVTIGVMLACLPLGLIGVVAGRVAVQVVEVPLHTLVACRMIGLPPTAVLRAVAAPIGAALVMAAAVALARRALDWPPALELGAMIALGAATYCGLLLALDRRRSLDLLRAGLARSG
ncbi:lipopolysaccharide biosynthesis protein [Jannaschia formosa]|uniref:lipopolysaccharide biosynthesis protein n=1 Tax=Jannaschia formosa TaxID=2259592 RepID=UPI000E1C3556|nr:lipopolysaccharide biosynthesis protein [Jannaschia formosa]TFL19235.1 lipopolysaccharide biosynthesis protein [Jannaschia formosa]